MVSIDVFCFDETSSDEFNVCNIDVRTPPNAIYKDVVEKYGMTTWMILHPYFSRALNIWLFNESDLNSIRSLAQIRCSSGRDIKPSDIDDFSSEFINYLNNSCSKYKATGVFCRMTHKSTKNGFGRLRPLHSAIEILDAVTSSSRLLKTIQPSVNGPQIMAIMPWVAINPEREYRVFVIDGRVAGISQQHCYIKFDNRDEKQVKEDAKQIIVWYDNNKSLLDTMGYQTVTLDIHIVSSSDDIDKDYLYYNDKSLVRLIECNPPSLWCASGSSLFREKDFEQCLSNKNVVTIIIR